MRTALRAVISEGSMRAAARTTSIPVQTISEWARSEDGKRIIEEERSKLGGELSEKILTIVHLGLDQIYEDFRARKHTVTERSIAVGILLDKLARLTKPAEAGHGELVVQVKFGGIRIARNGVAGDVEAAAGDVEIRARGST